MARLRPGQGPSLGPGLSPGSAFGGSFLLSIIILGIFSSSAHGTCYVPNGTDRNAGLSAEVYLPCDPGDEHSMCCASNRSVPDKCRSDGLCLSGNDGIVWRESCTDPTWKSPSCIKLCNVGKGQFIEGIDVDLATTDQSITPCDNGSFCCGNGTLANSCCGENKGLFVVNGKVVSQGAKSSVSETASSSSTKANLAPSSQGDPSHTTGTFTNVAAPQQTPTSTPSASSSSAAKSSDKTGAIVGGVIGGLAVVALLIGIIAWIWMHRNHRNTQGHATVPPTWFDQRVSRKKEVPEHTRTHEMDAVVPIAELEHSIKPHRR